MNKNIPALLLTPSLITGGTAVISFINIIKKGKSVNYETTELKGNLINKTFKNYPPFFKGSLMKCCIEELEELSFNLETSFSRRSAGIDHDTFYSKAFIKHWHKIFEELRPYFHEVKWYYKKEQPGKNTLLTSPCCFSDLKPALSFEVIKTNGVLQLKTYINFSETSYPLESFTRNHFLLSAKNELFILSHKDYQTLEKIESLDISLYGKSAEEFAKHILSHVESDYPVKRNQHIPEIEIDALPVCRVLLSELSNSFLMLTPQWVYDGFLIDGSFNDDTRKLQNGMFYSIKRNKEIEADFIKTLVSLHKNFANQRNGFFYLSFADAIKGQWFFKAYQQFLRMNIELLGMDMLANFRYSPHLPKTEMVTKEQNDNLIIFEMEVSFGEEIISLNELQKILLAGQKAVMLKDGSLAILDENWTSRYASILKHGKINKNEIEVLRWMAVSEHEKPGEKPALKDALQKEWWEKWQRWQKDDKEIYPLATGLNASLRPYQQKGYEWLLLLQEIGAGACLADDMGLGKTIQAISAIVYSMNQYPQSKNIIICPASLIYNWKEELEKFAPSLKTIVYHGAERQEDQLTSDAGIIITTYNTMRNDVEIISKQRYSIAVLDESHNIKNPSAQISQAVMRINARFRMALSGTPVINNTFDLYSQLHFVVPGLFGSREFFKREYANPIDNLQDEEKIATLKKLTAPFILRRTKEQVAKDLPEKTETILWCTMNKLQRIVYEEILGSTRSNLFLEIKSKGLAKSKLSILQAMTKLRQVCSSPLLLKDEEFSRCSESVKTEVLMEELDNILGKHKAIVFSQFAQMLHLLEDECQKRGIAYYHFDGQTPPDKRSERVKQFQKEDNNVHLFLISLKAGNTGLTLTAADYVFLFDPWWNNAVQEQAIDRTHRIGQTKNVFAYKMICKDTIEEKIISLQQKKKKLSEDLVSADNGFVKSLTEEEVQYLFS